MGASLIIVFLMGIVNFAVHRAIAKRVAPRLPELGWFARPEGRRVAFVFEFAVLYFAMTMAAQGFVSAGWAYGAYTAFNAGGAWFLLQRI
jgi:hypothetical protein